MVDLFCNFFYNLRFALAYCDGHGKLLQQTSVVVVFHKTVH